MNSASKSSVTKQGAEAVMSEKEDKFNAVGLELIKRLMQLRDRALDDNYCTTSGANLETPVRRISADNIRRARIHLERMNQAMLNNDIAAYNRSLLMYLSALLRPFKPGEIITADADSMNERLNWESAFTDAVEKMYLDTIAGIKKDNSINDSIDFAKYKEEIDWINRFGLSVFPADQNDIRFIKNMMGSDAELFIRAWRVSSKTTTRNFDTYVQKKNIQKTSMLWHGSPSVNFISILQNGLSLSKAGYGMFGRGIYFAPCFDKSRNYSSVSGAYWRGGSDSSAFLAIAEVATGKTHDVYYAGDIALAPDENCVWAHAGSCLRRDEVIVYDDSACNIKYIVETK